MEAVSFIRDSLYFFYIIFWSAICITHAKRLELSAYLKNTTQQYQVPPTTRVTIKLTIDLGIIIIYRGLNHPPPLFIMGEEIDLNTP
jgi:hypothetical protein